MIYHWGIGNPWESVVTSCAWKENIYGMAGHTFFE